MSWLRLLVFVAALSPAVTFVPHVLAQPAGGAGRALALGHEAIGLYNKGSWAEARAKFEEAEGLAHSPVFVLYLARCARNAGDLAAAKQAYERLAKEVVPKDAPAPWAAAVESAKQELPEVEARIATATAAASASTSASAPPTVAPAATAVPAATAAATSAPTATIPPDPSATTAATVIPPASSTSGPNSPPLSGAARGSLAPGAIALGAGAAGIGLGIGLFAHALSIAQGINAGCSVPFPEKLPDRNTAFSFADGATGAFVVGGVAVAAGVLLLIVRPGGKPAAPVHTVIVQPGLGSLRLSGSF